MSARRSGCGFLRQWFSDFSNQRFILGVSTTLLLAACGGGGGGGGGTAQPDAAPADNPSPSLTFAASTSSVTSGGSVTLSWQSTNTTSCQASGGWSGSRSTTGQETIGPLQQAQTFSLSCSGAGGGTLREVQVNVADDSEIALNLTSDVDSVSINDTVQLTWSSTNADSCEASGNWSGQVDTSGTFTSAPLTENALFQLTCFAQGQSAVSQLGVAVNSDISVSLTSDDDSVLIDDTVQLSWSSTNADSCVASGDWSGQVDTSGTFTSAPLTENALFQLTCSTQGQSEVTQLAVAVTDNVLRWSAPTANVDGTPLTDLTGFAVYWGNGSRNYSSSTDLGSGAREWALEVAPGTYYLAITAINSQAEESDYSNEIVKVIP